MFGRGLAFTALLLFLFALPLSSQATDSVSFAQSRVDGSDVSQLWTQIPPPPKPVLTIVYSANTFGELRPCPTCGGGSLGGLPRHAAALKKLKATLSDKETLLMLAGPDEFLGLHEDAAIQEHAAQTQLAAYAMLGYQRVFLSSREKSWFDRLALNLPKEYRSTTDTALTDEWESDGKRIGLVYFPDWKPAGSVPDQARVAQVIQAAEKLRPRVQLVIGVSPWGYEAEHALLGTLAPAFDVLLGGGLGKGVSGRVEADGSIVWARSHIKGRSVQILRILAWPMGEHPWVQEKTVSSELKILDAQIPEDPEMSHFMTTAFPPGTEQTNTTGAQ